MIITTTNSIQGKEITSYIDIVTSHTYSKIYDTKGLSFKESLSSSKAYEKGEQNIENAKKEAIEKVKKKASALGANAIVGLIIDVEVVREGISLGISVIGTAVSYK